MNFERSIIEGLIALSLKNGKIRIRSRAKDEYTIQANIHGTWVTLESVMAYKPRPKLAVSND